MTEIKRPNGDDIAKVYAEQTGKYVNFAPSSFSWLYVERPAFDRNLAGLITKSTKILDAGCGSGRTIEHMLNMGASPDNVVGVDVSKDMLDEARKRLPKVNLLQSDLTTVELANDNFDLITCCLVLHYLDDDNLRTTLSNFHRWLRDGGTLFYLATHPIRTVSDKLDEYFDRGWKMEDTPWGTQIPFYYRTVGDLLTETADAGFVINTVDEPMVNEQGKADPEGYKKYTSFPSRIAVKAIKKR